MVQLRPNEIQIEPLRKVSVTRHSADGRTFSLASAADFICNEGDFVLVNRGDDSGNQAPECETSG